MQVDYLIQERERFSVPKIMLMAGQWGVDVIKVIKPPHSNLHHTLRNNQHKQIRTRSLNCSLLFSLSLRHQDPSLTLAISPNGLPQRTRRRPDERYPSPTRLHRCRHRSGSSQQA
jgi:hypothetical protein